MLPIVSDLWNKIADMPSLSFKTAHDMNKIINMELPRRAPFQFKIVNIRDEHLEFHFRDVIKCIWLLYSDPRFVHNMAFTPEWHYKSSEHTCQIYNNIYTSDWWWMVQVCTIYSDKYCIDLVPVEAWVSTARGNNCALNSFLRQNLTYEFP